MTGGELGLRSLAVIDGRFLLSLNDVPQVRDIFCQFNFQEVEVTYTDSSAGATKAAEVIISK